MSKKVMKVATFGLGGLLMKKAGFFAEPEKLTPPAEPDVEIRAAAEAEYERMRKRKGASSTNVTGPLGLTTQPTTFKSTLGG